MDFVLSHLPLRLQKQARHFFDYNKNEPFFKNIKDIFEDIKDAEKEMAYIAQSQVADIVLATVNCLSHLTAAVDCSVNVIKGGDALVSGPA